MKGPHKMQAENDIIDPEPLAHMRRVAQEGDVWHVYENHDMGHRDLGRLTFLIVGPTRTFQEAPKHAPDSPSIGLGWRYQRIGTVDLEAGTVRKEGAG